MVSGTCLILSMRKWHNGAFWKQCAIPALLPAAREGPYSYSRMCKVWDFKEGCYKNIQITRPPSSPCPWEIFDARKYYLPLFSPIELFPAGLCKMYHQELPLRKEAPELRELIRGCIWSEALKAWRSRHVSPNYRIWGTMEENGHLTSLETQIKTRK